MVQSGIAGLADSGGAYAVLAVCLVLLYRTTGVLNFAVAATGTFGTFVMSVLYGHGWPYIPAALVGIAVGAVISVLFGAALARWFFNASSAHRAAVSVALLIATVAVAMRVFGDKPRLIPHALDGAAFTLNDVAVSKSSMIAFVFAIVVGLLVTLVLGRSRIGLRLRAISQGPVTSELLGLPVRLLSIGVWATTGVLATVAMLLLAPSRSSSITTLSLLVVPAMAAALVASFRRYRLAVVAGLGLGTLQGILAGSDTLSDVQAVIPFVAIVVLLLWFERKEVWDEAR